MPYPHVTQFETLERRAREAVVAAEFERAPSGRPHLSLSGCGPAPPAPDGGACADLTRFDEAQSPHRSDTGRTATLSPWQHDFVEGVVTWIFCRSDSPRSPDSAL